jgi:hypothetical protein
LTHWEGLLGGNVETGKNAPHLIYQLRRAQIGFIGITGVAMVYFSTPEFTTSRLTPVSH